MSSKQLSDKERKNLKLKELNFEIFQQEETTGCVFLITSKKEHWIFIWNSISSLFEKIDDDDKAFKQCMKEITLRLSNLETMQTNANKATHYASRHVDYAIKGSEDLMSIAEGQTS
ncbi:hypothetical protein Glove_291g29 [Diversispora epigaea]|uniref:Uncharacterized protein n=1 Tax=Diversispora epigaea TaxID=1348612 RepID=A0A397I6M0_9GLOM|nr:hypothetical protein Glove_291g29 [Diversispora epigaea]